MLDLRVRIVSTNVNSNEVWPLKVNRRITFGDLTAILGARFEGLHGPLVFFRQDSQQVGKDPTQLVADLVPDNDLLLVQEVRIEDEGTGIGKHNQTKWRNPLTPSFKNSNQKGGERQWSTWLGITAALRSPGCKGSPRAVVEPYDGKEDSVCSYPCTGEFPDATARLHAPTASVANYERQVSTNIAERHICVLLLSMHLLTRDASFSSRKLCCSPSRQLRLGSSILWLSIPSRHPLRRATIPRATSWSRGRFHSIRSKGVGLPAHPFAS